MPLDKSDMPAWFARTVFKAEALTEKLSQKTCKLPKPLARARKYEKNCFRESTRDIFYKQAKALEDYEDDFEFHGDPVRYFPTYESLTDDELRGYFTWRSRVRKGDYAAAPRTFLFLYLYELINNIGVKNPEEGYEKLLEIRRNYDSGEYRLGEYLDDWLRDYVVYYNLDKELLVDNSDFVNEQCLEVLDNVAAEQKDRVIAAVRQIAPKWLQRSRFYADHLEEMDTVIYKVLQRMAAHYAKTCKRSLVGQFFGQEEDEHVYLFGNAVFCDPLKRQDYEYRLSPQHIYMCEDGIWFTNRRVVTRRGIRKLDKFIKTIDALMRESYKEAKPIKSEISLKWLEKIIREEVRLALAEKKAKPVFSVDPKRLQSIRAAAALTRDKLIVEEEMPPGEMAREASIPEKSEQLPDQASLLSEDERHLLHCLLYGGDLSWLKARGLLLSVQVDAINEKLYDIFEDAVLDDSPAIVPDYIEELKEMIPA